MSRQAKSKKPKVPQSAVSSQTQSSFMSQTRQNNDVFATASVSQHQAPLQRTSPCDNTLKIQQTQKNESDTSTPTTPTKRPSSPLIAYVQSLSPVKRSKKGSLLYFNLKLQSASATHPAVCFSRSKRSFLDDRAATKTALKLERYNISEDGRTIFINDMTKLSSPATSEYNFQFTDIQKTGNSTLQSMLQNAADMDIVDVTAKVVYKDNEPQIVGASKLKKSNCHIADQTTQLKLILWENNIDEVNVEEVYSFKQLRLRRDGQTTVLNTTVDTVIEKKLDSNLQQLVVEGATPEEESELNIKVDSIYSIEELSRFKQCLHCNKKIKQVTASTIVKCDHCGHVVRNSLCKENLMVKFLVQTNDNSDERFHHFVVFQEVLQQMIGTSLQTMTDDMIFEKLLLLNEFTIYYNNQNIVKRVAMQ